jgi:hypothetical protein
MKHQFHARKRVTTLGLMTLITALGSLGALAENGGAQENAEPGPAPDRQSAPIPFDQIGSVAQKQYSGDGLAVTATADGALLRCVFRRLEGRATKGGLWLTSTEDGASGEPFRVKSMAVVRDNPTRCNIEKPNN